MNTPYGLEIIENCVTCKLRKDKWFCGLSPNVLRAFSDSSHLSTYPGGAVLFVEGQMPRGGLVLCSGKVKLSTTSRDGKVLILKMAVPGEALGLSAVISGTPYEVTAETAGPCQVNSIDRDSLMRLLDKHGELGLHSAQALSREFQSAYREIHELVLARSSVGKLARLLLSWGNGREREGGTTEIRIKSSLTHEEIAQMIGSSRETVTRLLSELKKKEMIRLEGSTLSNPQSNCFGSAGCVAVVGSPSAAEPPGRPPPPPPERLPKAIWSCGRARLARGHTYPYNPNNSRRRLVWALLTGISVCFLSSIRSW